MASSDDIKLNVLKLQQANATPQDIEAYVQTATKEMATSGTPSQVSQPTEQLSFNYGKDLVGSGPQQQTIGLGSNLFQNTIGSGGVAGVAQLPGKAIAAVSEYGPGGQHQAEQLHGMASDQFSQAADLLKQARTVTDPVKQQKMRDTANQLIKSGQQSQKAAGDISGMTDTTPGQAAGTTINAGLTVGTSGSGSLASKATGTFGKLALGATEGAGLGAGYQVGSNLQQGKPIGENVKSSALIGAAIPVGTQALSGLKSSLQKGAQMSSEGIINRIIKPSIKDLGYGSEPARGILNEKITANSLGDLKSKVANKLATLGSTIGRLGQKVEQKIGPSLDLSPALTPLDQAMAKAAKLNNPTLLTSLNNVKTALTHELSMEVDNVGLPSIIKGNPKNLSGVGYADAIKLMEDVKQHVKFTGNPSDDKALNIAVQDTYRNLRQIMNKAAVQADPQIGKEIINLNQRYGDLSSAQQAVSHREMIAQKNNFFNLATSAGLVGSVGLSIAKAAATGDWSSVARELMVEAGVAGGVKALGSTAVQNRVARFLDALGPSERAGILQTTPVLKNLYERVTGKSATVESVAQQAKSVPTQTLSELSGMNADQVKEITPFLELGKRAAQKSGMGEQYNKLISAIKEAHTPPSFLSHFDGDMGDANWNNKNYEGKQGSPLFLPEGKIQLPSPGVLEGQTKLRGKDSGTVRQTAVNGGIVAGIGGMVQKAKDFVSPEHYVAPTDNKNTDTTKIREAIAHNETRGEKKPYSFSQPSGVTKYGKALGKYQITEAELKSYAPKLLGNAISAKDFLSNPSLQDKYMEAKINYLKQKGLSVSQIFAAHRGGFSDLAKINEKVKNYANYVKSGLESYKNQ